ncbi:M23 family metallopeptidase [Lysinibacillus xylanilyticus]|uniref:peptidoglycan DD-metalloendopeptidase family protein n=1 Tax=Lysinibacillus xylanilyticus TaxID=582475 RepID=UPI002B255345|nr:peptidoglycan DD-metalloendopeptidase family protein [Lysinibacillus xylanilyticus]MEB2302010.1 M23 family metallopeptidase [Lysinibacillus xylanilyticus]
MEKFSSPEEVIDIWLGEGFEKIYNATSKDFQKMVTLEQFMELSKSFNNGVKNYRLETKTILRDLTHYVWSDDKREKAVVASFDEFNQIQRFYIKPFTTYPKTDQQYTKNKYIMPIRGEWFVFWGGTNEVVNYHYIYENQRYAYDLVKVQDGQSYQKSPVQNENFYAFDEDIVAPADGKIVKVVDGIKDNVPGEMDERNAAGNYVVIEHANNEFSMIAHFKKNSILVKSGDVVTEGQLIGKCGNSGNSSEPHIHFQVMDSPEIGYGKSIRILFKDGNEPIQGDTIS